MKNNTIGVAAIAAAFALNHAATASTVTFETLALPPESFYNGSDQSGGIALGGATLNNNYNNDYGSWSGFAVSNRTDTTTPGYSNQYSAYAGGGAAASANFAVGYYNTYDASTTDIAFARLTNFAGRGASFTNTTYAALDMLMGGDFGSKKFGGSSGNDADWFLLTATGFVAGIPTGSSVNFYLADFRFANNAQDYIVKDWQYVDFSPLGDVDELRLSMTSSDVGFFGMNTPSYFAMDNLSIPEPSALCLACCAAGLFLVRKR